MQPYARARERESRETGPGDEAKYWNRRQARIDGRSGGREISAQSSASDERRCVLESRSAVAYRRRPKSCDRIHVATQSNFAAIRKMDTAHARWFFRSGAA